MKFATRAVHSGSETDEQTGALMPPIYMTSTFCLEAPEKNKGFTYTRANNPNFERLERLLTSLEEAQFATVFSTGMGAMSSLASTLSQNDKVVALNGIYGGTYRLFTHVFEKLGIEFIELLVPSPAAIEKALELKPKLLLFETPTNPMMNIFDISAMAQLAKKHGVQTLVDNTFASPYCQSPLKLGADIVLHSTTKYISGHSDVLGGVVLCNNLELKQKLDFSRKTLGTSPSPFDTWLIQRGAKTLPLRMEQHQKNAKIIAEFLESHPKVSKVYWPGLTSHPEHSLAKKQMKAFSGMLSAEFKLPPETLKKFVSSLKYFALAESLGGIESLISHPATMTHAILPKEEREALGITDQLVRFSIGIEDPQDLLEDLQQGLG